MTTYSVQEAFQKLRALKITSNEESVRRWLRTGKLKGYQQNKKQGWRITETDLQHFIDQRLPAFCAVEEQSVNTTIVVKEEAIREQMWFEIVQRNIFEGYVDVKKSRLKECIEHKHYSKEFFVYCWDELMQQNRNHAIPRVSYLLDAFLYDSKRIKMDHSLRDTRRESALCINRIFEGAKSEALDAGVEGFESP